MAPGAIGLAVGLWYGSSASFGIGPLLALRCLSACVTRVVRDAASPASWPVPARARLRGDLPLAAIGALLLSVTIRAAVGTAVGVRYRAEPEVLPWLALAAFLGKAVGGPVADRLGWTRTSIVALVASAPLLSVLAHSPPLAVLGMLAFQMTMPVALMAAYHAFPREPGFAFGLPCLALLVGTLPAFFLPSALLAGVAQTFGLTILSIAALLLGLPPLLALGPRAHEGVLRSRAGR